MLIAGYRASMTCGGCGTELRSGAEFCLQCGLAQRAACAQCCGPAGRPGCGRGGAGGRRRGAALWRVPTPHHLAHALLDPADHLLTTGDGDAAARNAVGEATEIVRRLAAAPLGERARGVTKRLTSVTVEAGHG
jgi:hypothetical protein